MKAGSLVELADLGVSDVSFLPDWVFGQRVPVCFEAYSAVAGTLIRTSEVRLPERVVLWEVQTWNGYYGAAGNYVRLALVDKAVTTEAGVEASQSLLKDVGLAGAEPQKIQLDRYFNEKHWSMKLVVESHNRFLCACFVAGVGGIMSSVTLVYSWVPTRIPVWVAKSLGFDV
jgi:hypothetical protein